MMKKMVIFGGNSNQELLIEICQKLDKSPGKALVSRFPDTEIKVEIEENVRGKDVFIVQSTSPPVDENLMELLVMIDALRRASAFRVTAVMPYYGYARQDRKHKGRVPITGRLVADLLEASGADRVLAIDLHASQIQGFFKIPVDHFPGHIAFRDSFKNLLPDLVIVAPDTGGRQRASSVAKKLEVSLAIIDKRRVNDRKTEVRNVIGEVENKTALLVDDIISTGGTMAKDAEVLKIAGATRVIACATHGIFAPGSAEILDNSEIESIYVTDTVKTIFPLPQKVCYQNSMASFLAEGILRIHKNRSVGEIIEHT
jgi:ribose-phosphate pyrophosphokinase